MGFASRTGRHAFAGALGLTLAVATIAAPAAQAAKAPPAGTVKVQSGSLSPSGLARVAGTLPKHTAFKPAAFVFSHNPRFDRSDVTVAARSLKATKGRFAAVLALPDVLPTGKYQLLACRTAKPAAASCVPVGAVKVVSAPAVPIATPALDSAHAVSGTVADAGGTVTATAADGTTFVLTVPAHSTPFQPITLTPVTTLTPAGAVGRLVDGVMIEPVGVAPSGSTLEIKRSSWPGGARAVGFGGVDPSGGAFALPAKVSTDTQIPVEFFGGYGVTVPTGAKAAAARVRTVPCAPPTSSAHTLARRAAGATAEAAAAGSRPLMSCISIADRWNSLSKTADAALASGNIALLQAIYAADAQAVAGEMAQVLAQPPTESGSVELDILVGFALGMSRQVQLAGLPDALLAPVDLELPKAFDYKERLARSVCMGSAKHPTAVYIDYFTVVFGILRQQLLVGGGETSSDTQALEQACLEKIKLTVTGKIDATEDNGQWTSHVVAGVTATITGTAAAKLESGDPAISFSTSSSQADPSFASSGGSATTTSSQGTFHPEPITTWVAKQLRCNKNRQFEYDRTAFIAIAAVGLWDDGENVQLAVNGNTFGLPTTPQSTASTAWDEGYALANPRVTLQLDGPEVAPTNSGSCTHTQECQSYALTSSSLSAVQVEN